MKRTYRFLIGPEKWECDAPHLDAAVDEIACDHWRQQIPIINLVLVGIEIDSDGEQPARANARMVGEKEWEVVK